MCQKLCGCHCVSLLLGTARALLWPAEAKALKALSSLAYANAGTVGQAVAPFCACWNPRRNGSVLPPGRAGAPSSVGHPWGVGSQLSCEHHQLHFGVSGSEQCACIILRVQKPQYRRQGAREFQSTATGPNGHRSSGSSAYGNEGHFQYGVWPGFDHSSQDMSCRICIEMAITIALVQEVALTRLAQPDVCSSKRFDLWCAPGWIGSLKKDDGQWTAQFFLHFVCPVAFLSEKNTGFFRENSGLLHIASRSWVSSWHQWHRNQSPRTGWLWALCILQWHLQNSHVVRRSRPGQVKL